MAQQDVVIAVVGFVGGVLVTNAAWWLSMLHPRRRLARGDRYAERGIFAQALERARSSGDMNGAKLIEREAALRGIQIGGRS